MRLLRGLLATLLACGCANADNWTPAKKIDVYFDALAAHELANGSIAISEKGVLKYQRAIGSAVIAPGRNEAADTGTRYRIGSVSKLFTAVLIMQLAERATITLDSKLAEFFPDLPNALEITYRDLLQHRSGLADYTRMPGFEEWRQQPHTRGEVLKLITDAGAQFQPRERYEYSNSNYLLLSYVLEKIYDKPFADIVRTQIIDRLGLARTYYGQSMTASRHEALPYEFKPAGWIRESETDPGLHLGAGGMVSSPSDLVRFMDALFAGKLVTERSLDTLRGTDGEPVGLPPFELSGHTAYGHAGRVDEYQASVYHFPGSGITISYASNAAVLAPDEIVGEVLALLFDRGHRPRTFTPVKLPKGKLDEYVGTWRSAPGQPVSTTFRQFAPPGHPPEISIRRVGDTLVCPVSGRDYPLTPLGEDEFIIEGVRYFLRAYPRTGEVVVRSAVWAYYFKRAE